MIAVRLPRLAYGLMLVAAVALTITFSSILRNPHSAQSARVGARRFRHKERNDTARHR
jgi:hypothetical protein